MTKYYRIVSLGLVAYMTATTSTMASLISVVGNGVIVAPPAQVLNAGVTNSQQWGFNERQGVLLGFPLAVDNGSLAAGTVVDSHMIFLNGATGQSNPPCWVTLMPPFFAPGRLHVRARLLKR